VKNDGKEKVKGNERKLIKNKEKLNNLEDKKR
jgi:hypothetical protein